jgi:uncharacterized membrane protein
MAQSTQSTTTERWREPRSETQHAASPGPASAVLGSRILPGLTWFSLALGVGQLVAPGALAQLIGLRDSPDTRLAMRLIGLRELVAGAGLLSGASTPAWLGARTGGDLMDLGMLSSALGSKGVNRARLYKAMAAVAGVTALDIYGAMKAHRDTPHSPTSAGRPIPTTKTIVVNREPAEVYRFWHDFEQLPRFMQYLESVQMLGNSRSRWKARGPGGKLFEWEAETLEDRPNELIRWRSLPGSQVETEGSVRFERAPGGRGTLVRVNLRYDPPAGAVGSMIATLFGREPGQEVQEDLRRFKQVLETGEVMRSDASIHDRMHPARPTEEPYSPESVVYAPGSRPTRTQEDEAHRDDRPDELDGQPRTTMSEVTTALGGTR